MQYYSVYAYAKIMQCINIFQVFMYIVFEAIIIVHVTFGTKLPFQCPYQTPEGNPKPTADLTVRGGGGLDPFLYANGDLDDETRNTYAQYRAALALVPCNARALSVFTKQQLGTNFTVAVLFVYEESVRDLKLWLK